MPKSNQCACGIRSKVHSRKSRRGQLPGLATDRRGYPVVVRKDRDRGSKRIITVEEGS